MIRDMGTVKSGISLALMIELSTSDIQSHVLVSLSS